MFINPSSSACEDTFMLADLVANLGLADTEIWLPSVIGFACGCLTTLFVRATVKRGPRQPPAPPTKSTAVNMPGLYELAAKGVSAEKRSSARRSGNAIPVFVAEREGAPVRGFVVDRSAGGVCLALDHSVRVGTVLRV